MGFSYVSNYDVEKFVSVKIANMSFVCALLIVCFHVGWPLNESKIARMIFYSIGAGGLGRIAVPFFFFVSGFYLARHFDDTNWYKREVLKRVKSLLIPFYVWCFIGLLVTFILSACADIVAGRQVFNSFLSMTLQC